MVDWRCRLWIRCWWLTGGVGCGLGDDGGLEVSVMMVNWKYWLLIVV